MNTIEHFETNEPIETYEKRLADLNSRVSTATRTLLKSGIAMLEAQVKELGRRIEPDKIATPSQGIRGSDI